MQQENLAIRLMTNAERAKLYGQFAFIPAPTPENLERIQILDDWKAKSLVKVHLTGVESAAGPDDAWVHKLVAPHLEALLAAWNVAGLSGLVLAWNGAFAARFKRGRAPASAADLAAMGPARWSEETRAAMQERLSAHSFGSAFDINARWNPMGKPPLRAELHGSVIPLVAIAEGLGWIWGGRWKGASCDPMHFELAEIGGLV